MTTKAVGIIRVSELGGRDDPSSPKDQREAIEKACKERGLRLVEVFEEIDVSGRTPLAKRPGLSRAVEMVQEWGGGVLVFAYFDRMVRSLKVQTELLERVEAAGGKVLALDAGEVSNGTAGEWLSATMRGMMAEYQARSAEERSRDGIVRAIKEKGVPAARHDCLGYRREKHQPYQPHPEHWGPAREAWQMRANEATIEDVRQFLKGHGIERSHGALGRWFQNRTVLGEIRWGDVVNPKAHTPLVDLDTFNRVQRVSIPRGPTPKSDRLLARLGVLRCGTCGARLIVGASNHGKHPTYRCPPNNDCPRRVSIAAGMVEKLVTDAVREHLAGIEGQASAERNINKAETELEQAQDALDTAFRTFAGFEDEQAARERLKELREARDAAREHLEQLGGSRIVRTVSVDDWDDLSLAGRRDLIRATMESVTVNPGRGPDRVTIQFLGE
jgi:DNA invertase Pin-like site-specific DNA recombinase